MKVTVCTTFHAKKGAPPSSLVRSCKKAGVELKTFGLENSFVSFLETKLKPLLAFVEGVTSSHAMFLDGTDTFLVAPLAEIATTYQEIANGKVLIGSELWCWPYRKLWIPLSALAESQGFTSPYKYIDTGLMMGPTEVLREMLRAVIESAEHYRAIRKRTPRWRIEDDVGLFSLNVCDGKIDPVIDYNCQIIAALRNTTEADYALDRRLRGRLHLNLTGTNPCVIHCNGHRWADRHRLKVLYHALCEPDVDVRKAKKEGYVKGPRPGG